MKERENLRFFKTKTLLGVDLSSLVTQSHGTQSAYIYHTQ